MTTPVASHLYIASSDVEDRCSICTLPEANLRHNARPVRLNRRTRRTEYTDQPILRKGMLR